MMTDRALGSLLLVCNTCFFVYYVLWIGVMPFVDESHFTQALFLPREYGLLLAALVMTTAIGIGMTVGSLHTIWRTGYVPPTATGGDAEARALGRGNSAQILQVKEKTVELLKI